MYEYDMWYLYYPFLHSTTVSHYVWHVHSVQWNAGMGIPSLYLKYFRIKFLLLVIMNIHTIHMGYALVLCVS